MLCYNILEEPPPTKNPEQQYMINVAEAAMVASIVIGMGIALFFIIRNGVPILKNLPWHRQFPCLAICLIMTLVLFDFGELILAGLFN
jgi:hypothetical protein